MAPRLTLDGTCTSSAGGTGDARRLRRRARRPLGLRRDRDGRPPRPGPRHRRRDDVLAGRSGDPGADGHHALPGPGRRAGDEPRGRRAASYLLYDDVPHGLLGAGSHRHGRTISASCAATPTSCFRPGGEHQPGAGGHGHGPTPAAARRRGGLIVARRWAYSAGALVPAPRRGPRSAIAVAARGRAPRALLLRVVLCARAGAGPRRPASPTSTESMPGPRRHRVPERRRRHLRLQGRHLRSRQTPSSGARPPRSSSCGRTCRWSPAGPSFPDLDDVYRDYVETACAQGWITGFADGRFRPYSTLTRQQMAIIMVRAMGWEQRPELSAAQIARDALPPSPTRRRSPPSPVPTWPSPCQRGSSGETATAASAPRTASPGPSSAWWCSGPNSALRAVIQEVRCASDYPDKTRVVIDLSRAPGKVTAAHLRRRHSHRRLHRRRHRRHAHAGGRARPRSRPSSARQFAYDPRTVRITFDLGRYQTFRVMSLAPSEGKGYRIVVDVYRRTDGPRRRRTAAHLHRPRPRGQRHRGHRGLRARRRRTSTWPSALLLADRPARGRVCGS